VATDVLKAWKAAQLDTRSDVNSLLTCEHGGLLPKTGAQSVPRK
jgi:hypothetical protein